MLRVGFLFTLFLFATTVWAYPDFIAYGYKTCVMCHYNSQGNGPLTDYGRALFSQEIAARNFWTSKKVTDEEIAEKYSGFIPGTELPWWIRPSIKYRGLWVKTNPGSSKSKTRWINMQRDFNLAISFDEASRTVLVLNYGLTYEKEIDYYGDGKKVSAISREHYLRTYIGEKLLVAAGLMDKVYGIRTGDHTAYSRGGLDIGQDSQVHGLLLQWMEEEWDLSFHGWAGNMFRPKDARKPGGSIQFEYGIGEKDRIGFSAMTQSNKTIKESRFGIHNRWGFPKSYGSILVELGVKQDQLTGSKATLGSYGLIQSMINITRGFNLLTIIERAQRESKFSSPEQQRWTLGFLTFPLQRTEVRMSAVQEKNFSAESVSRDNWQIQGQVHVSW